MKTKEELNRILEESTSRIKENRDFFKKLKRIDKKQLDKLFHQYHQEVFEQIDCLDCANCCKSIGPRVLNIDINRLSAELKIKPSDLVSTYLRIDEDGDYVFKIMPCPFLGFDNYCSVYNNHPIACREYPHTNRNKMYQILDITLENTKICPAVALITEKLKQKILLSEK